MKALIALPVFRGDRLTLLERDGYKKSWLGTYDS